MSTVTAGDLLRCALVAVLVLIIQLTIGLDIRIDGAHPDLMLLVPIAAGLVGGPVRGAWAGFGAGLLADLFLPTPFGLSALVYCLVGFTIGYVLGSTGGPDPRRIWWMSPLVALAASAAGSMLFAVLGAVLGQEQLVTVDLAAVVSVVAVTNAILAPLSLPLLSWAFGIEQERSRGRRRHRVGGRRPLFQKGDSLQGGSALRESRRRSAW